MLGQQRRAELLFSIQMLYLRRSTWRLSERAASADGCSLCGMAISERRVSVARAGGRKLGKMVDEFK